MKAISLNMRNQKRKHKTGTRRGRLAFEMLEPRIQLDASLPLFLYEWDVHAFEDQWFSPGNEKVWEFFSKGEGDVLAVDPGRHEFTAKYYTSGDPRVYLGVADGFAEWEITVSESPAATNLNISYKIEKSFASSVRNPIYGSANRFSAVVSIWTKSDQRLNVSGRLTTSRLWHDDLGASASFGMTHRIIPGGAPEGIGIEFTTNTGVKLQPFTKEYEGATYHLVTQERFVATSMIGDSNNVCGPAFSWSTCGTEASGSLAFDLSLTAAFTQGPEPEILHFVAAPAFADSLELFGDLADQSSDGRLPVHEITAGMPLSLKATVDDSLSSAQYDIIYAQFYLTFNASGDFDGPVPVRTFLQPNGTRNNEGLLVYEITVIPEPIQAGRQFPYGQPQTARAAITYRDRLTGRMAMSFKQHEEFDVFFLKFGDDNNNGIANWFEHWKSENHNATSHGNFDFVRYGGSFYIDHLGRERKARGGYVPLTGEIYLFDQSTYSRSDFVLPEIFKKYEKPKQGIDLVENVLSHEMLHKYITEHSQERFGPSSDSDGIPDDLEVEINRALGVQGHPTLSFRPNDPNSFLEWINPASGDILYWSDDQELLARLVSLGAVDIPEITQFVNKGRSAYAIDRNDWANPGRNTAIRFDSNKVSFGEPTATLTGGVTHAVGSADSRGLYESLQIEVGVDAFQRGTYGISVTLQDSTGGLHFAAVSVELSPGEQMVSIEFDGGEIFQRRIDGSFVVREIVLIGEEFEEFLHRPHSTRLFSHKEFSPFGEVTFGDRVSAAFVQNEAMDSKILQVTVPLNSFRGASEPEAIFSRGFLYTKNGDPLGYAEASFTDAEYSGDLVFMFDMSPADYMRYDGDLELKFFSLFDSNGELLDYLPDLPHESIIYNRGARAGEILSLASQGIVMSEGEVKLGVDLLLAGLHPKAHTLIAGITDSRGRLIDYVSAKASDVTLEGNVEFYFSGTRLAANQVDGPFNVRIFGIYTDEMQLLDILPRSIATESYFWGEFIGDFDSPSSSFAEIAETKREAEIPIEWIGADGQGGTGIRYYDIFVSENGMPFETLLSATTENMTIFQGEFGKSYEFAVVATDNARNKEDLATSSRAVVSLISPWLNGANRFDVNADGLIAPFDALLVLNFLSRHQSAGVNVPRRLSDPSEWPGSGPFWDVDGNGLVSALDALQVLNEISRGIRLQTAGEGEGVYSDSDSANPPDEFSPRDSTAAFAPPFFYGVAAGSLEDSMESLDLQRMSLMELFSIQEIRKISSFAFNRTVTADAVFAEYSPDEGTSEEFDQVSRVGVQLDDLLVAPCL